MSLMIHQSCPFCKRRVSTRFSLPHNRYEGQIQACTRCARPDGVSNKQAMSREAKRGAYRRTRKRRTHVKRAPKQKQQSKRKETP